MAVTQSRTQVNDKASGAEPMQSVPTSVVPGQAREDIGGPTMLRAAAKNHARVTVVTDPKDYKDVIKEIDANNQTTIKTRRKLAIKVFQKISEYDSMIHHYLVNQEDSEEFTLPSKINITLEKINDLRYGENPHQNASLYDIKFPEKDGFNFEQLAGKDLSYNNLVDTESAISCVNQFKEPSCVIVKHANPCGVAESENIFGAYDLAFKTDPTSAFGGIIALNRILDTKTAQEINSRQFVEVILATDYEEGALAEFAKKKNVRVLKVDLKQDNPYPGMIKKVSGGILIQSDDTFAVSREDLKCVTKRQPTPDELNDLMFAWRVAKFVKSNAIVYVKNRQTIGIGAGQMSRVISADIANLKAKEEGLEVQGAVMASDAFFPFRDGIDKAASSGIASIIQPGGSMRDNEVIAAADENDIAMVFTNTRHFRH